MIKNMYTMLSYIFIILVIFCVMHVFYYNDQKLIFDNYDGNDNINNFLKEKFNVQIDLNSNADTTLYVNDLISLNNELDKIIAENQFPLPTISPSDKTNILNNRQSKLINIKNLLTNLYTTRFAARMNELNAATYNSYNQYV